MAKQTGIFRVEGLLDNMSFYKTDGEYKIRRKGGVGADRIANDPAFRKLRATTADFSRAARAGKLLRDSIGHLIKQASDGKVVSRLTRDMFRVLQADKTHPRGQRHVIDGEAELLTGFEFNSKSPLSSTFGVQYAASIDREAGSFTIDIDAFNPVDALVAPRNTTYFKIKSAGIEIDFEKNRYAVDTQQTDVLPMNKPANPIQIKGRLPADSLHPLMVVLGIEYLAQEGGANAALLKAHSNPLAIVHVSGL